VPSLAEAGSGHWKCPLYQEKEEEDEHEHEQELEQRRRWDKRWAGNSGGVYTQKPILV